MQVRNDCQKHVETGYPFRGDDKLPFVKHFETTLHSSPLLNLNAGREAILDYFRNTWSLTELLFSSLTSRQAFFLRPYHKTRHPLVFYYAHPVCFYVNKLLVSGLIAEPVNQDFELLFETGVDEMNWDDLHEGADDIWPDLEEVIQYRNTVYRLVENLIETHPCFDQPITMDSQGWALVMAFEHERIHLETSSVLIRELPQEHVTTPTGWPEFFSCRESASGNPQPGKDYPAQNPMLEVKPSTLELGKPRQWPTFGWDNEYGHDKRQVSSFKASKYLVSNGEFFRFVASGGYETRKYWSESGWGWRTFRNVKWPTFWVQDGPAGSHRYRLRSTFSVVDMQWDWPAIVNYFEARAYCAWLSESEGVDTPYRLLREAEHLALREPALRKAIDWTPGRDQLLKLDPVMTAQGLQGLNLNLQTGSECPVNAMAENTQGFHDTMGNVWQWCEDAFHPLKDFAIHSYYTDFSTPCFDGEHQMIMGGSFISTGDEASIWSRFHFRPHFFQHAGFRLAQSGQSPAESNNKYETSQLVDQYLLFHYGSEAEQADTAIRQRSGHPQVGNFVLHTAELMSRFASGRRRALDLGCAVGRASFELAREFESVTGLDYSASFIRCADHLREHGKLPYRRRDTGRFFTELLASVPGTIDRNRVHFVEGDACALDSDLAATGEGPFDAALLANLLCRLSDPEACLRQFVESDRWLGRDGILVIASPNTWSEQYTEAENFLDGKDSAETLNRLGSILQGFELVFEEDYPFMIREHRRKYEYIVSQISVWKKGSGD
ncbi:MAG: 5-histidylcysteine sulfoxide synthase [Gammaproteobacteria bacterium]|nr:5-histidylcysteine sulfoxide synthase [Pseudomonadales bacterium]MCP5347877.1 5-histidylcysteine sulfoxide synthase [Pseudomonadales bacterium]